MELKNNLKLLRKNYNLTQKDVAEALHIATTTYQTYEQGTCEPNIDMLKRLSKYYKVSIDKIVDNKYKDEKTLNVLEIQSLMVQLNEEHSSNVLSYLKFLIQNQNKK